jgi:uncharacterized membrane protein HdeD (DUF308 family)
MLAIPGRSLNAIINLLGIYFLVLGAIRLVRSIGALRNRRVHAW